MPEIVNQTPQGEILPQSKHGFPAEEGSKGEILPQSKHGDVDSLKDILCLKVGDAIAGEPFFRLTEQGLYRIVEESLDLRILQDAP